MKTDFTQILDIALEKIRSGEPVDDVLAQFPAESDELKPLIAIIESFRELEPVEEPTQAELATDRRAFLAQARLTQDQAVSLPLAVRLKRWTNAFTSWLTPSTSKEKKPMTLFLMRAAVALVLVIASTGGTAALAANSLPDSALYPAKLAMEQVQLNLTGNPERKATRNLVIAQERVTEMVRLVQQGDTPDDAVMLKLEQHLNTALRLTAHLGDKGMSAVLNQAQEMIQSQIEELNRVRLQTQESCVECVCQALQLLERAQLRVQEGLQDGNGFRLRYQHESSESLLSGEPSPTRDENQYGQNAEIPASSPGQPGGNPDCNQSDTEDCIPVGEQNQYGQEADPPSADSGQPYGNPDCECCESLGDAYKYGQTWDGSGAGPGEPGGNPDCTDCVPGGDANKYGQNSDGSGAGQQGGNEEANREQKGPNEQPGPGGSRNKP